MDERYGKIRLRNKYRHLTKMSGCSIALLACHPCFADFDFAISSRRYSGPVPEQQSPHIFRFQGCQPYHPYDKCHASINGYSIAMRFLPVCIRRRRRHRRPIHRYTGNRILHIAQRFNRRYAPVGMQREIRKPAAKAEARKGHNISPAPPQECDHGRPCPTSYTWPMRKDGDSCRTIFSICL